MAAEAIKKHDHATERLRKALDSATVPLSIDEVQRITGLTLAGVFYAMEQLARKGRVNIQLTKKDP